MNAITLFLGFLFGAALAYSKLNRFNTISGMAVLENFTVAKAISAAIGIGIILINIEIAAGFASYHIKPILLGGIIAGGLIFGSGMAILGYCPGTLPVSLGEGSVDALFGIIGGLAGGLFYTVLAPFFSTISGPDLGTHSLNSMTGTNFMFFLLIFIIGGLFIAISLWIHKIDKFKDYKWLFSAFALAVLNAFIFLHASSDRQIGASTAYPYISDILTGTTENEYFTKLQKSGNWELIFVTGAFIAGLVFSLIRKEFRLTLIHDNWLKYKGDSSAKRVIWSLTGGFLLITGARMAGGCTSGHIISGGMQLAASSLIFAMFVFAGLLITGRVFYNKPKT